MSFTDHRHPTTDTRFYIAGGTLAHDAPSYLERQADRDLYDYLRRGDFCYILTARQLGKSSLMVRTAYRLQQEGTAVIILDLTALGRNVTDEQWCSGLAEHVGMALNLEEELDDFWEAHARLGPMQRWLRALRQVVLARTPSPVVIFVDEIDAVRSLPFSTDEFFAGLRECYNRRAQDPELQRLTFCLLGVATPSDLIQDVRTTPFNIGRRIELQDFTAEEAAPLAAGLWPATNDRRLPTNDQRPTTNDSNAHRLLKRVLYWTGGHPYLTQRLCQALAERGRSHADAGTTSLVVGRWSLVDDLCRALFLSPGAREQDDNLLFVRDRLLRSPGDLAGLLELYAQVRRGKPVPVEESNERVSTLRLSGITRVAAGRLRVRNRIYARVFDRAWIAAHMPEAEVRRQRAAYRRGLVRTGAVASLIIATTGWLAFRAIRSETRANQAAARAQAATLLAREEGRRARHLLYAAQTKVAEQNCAQSSSARARELLETWSPAPGEADRPLSEDLRGFEWRYLWRICQKDALATLSREESEVMGVPFSPDGRLMASGHADGSIGLWDVASRRQRSVLMAYGGHPVRSLAFLPDGRTLAVVYLTQWVILWDTDSGAALASFPAGEGGHGIYYHQRVACSRAANLLAVAGSGGIRLWKLPIRPGAHPSAPLPISYSGSQFSLAFSPDGRLLATGIEKGSAVVLWDIPAHREIARLQGHDGQVTSVAFSPDGSTLASAGVKGGVRLWDVAARRLRASLPGVLNAGRSVAFSRDGRFLIIGSEDAMVHRWDLATGQVARVHWASARSVDHVAVSPDGARIALGSGDGTIGLWRGFPTVDTPKERAPTWAGRAPLLRSEPGAISALTFAPDGRTLAVARTGGRVTLWEAPMWRPRVTLEAEPPRGARLPVAVPAPPSGLIFSRDGRLLASGDSQRVALWQLPSRRLLAALEGSSASSPSVALSPDGKLLLWGWGRAIRVWDVLARKELAPLKGHTGDVWGLAFSPNGLSLASFGGEEAMVRLLEVGSWRALPPFQADADPHTPLLFFPDGRTLVTNAEGALKLQDVATRRSLHFLRGQTLSEGGVAIAPDGRTLATCNRGSVTLWNVPTRQEVATLGGHRGGSRAVAFSPDGRYLVSGAGDGTLRIWEAASFREADTLRVIGMGSDRTVHLNWRPLPSVAGYNLYRGPAEADGPLPEGAESALLARGPWSDLAPPDAIGLPGSSRLRFVRLNARPVAETSYTEQKGDLVNGRSRSYAVAPVYTSASGAFVEGPRSVLRVTPVAAPPGWLGTSIGERRVMGSVAHDVATGEIRLRGSGADFWFQADSGYFLNRPVTGDFRITVGALGKPTASHPSAKAGLMLRESLEASARTINLLLQPDRSLIVQWRSTAGGYTETWQWLQLPQTSQNRPSLLRLTRRGETITAEYSDDEGRRFHPAGDPLSFPSALPRQLYVGLAITAHRDGAISEARFRDITLTTVLSPLPM